MILFPGHCWEIVLGKSLFSVCLSLDILIHFSKMLSLQGCYLYKDVIFTAESLERQRWNLPPERRTSLFPVKVLVAQSCPALYNPLDSSPLTSSVHGILQAIILEWVAIPSPGDLPDPGIEPRSPALQADSLPSEPPFTIKGSPLYKNNWRQAYCQLSESQGP